MDFTTYYRTAQQPFLYPPTPHADFDADSPPVRSSAAYKTRVGLLLSLPARIANHDKQNGFGAYDQFHRYDDGIQTPASSQHGVVKPQPLELDHDMHEASMRGRSSSEEKELTPAQSVRANPYVSRMCYPDSTPLTIP